MDSCVPVFVSGQVVHTPKPLLLHIPHRQQEDGSFVVDNVQPDMMQWLIHFHRFASLPTANHDWSSLYELATEWKLHGLQNYIVEEHQSRKRSFRDIFQHTNKKRRSMSVEEMMQYSDAVM